MANNPVKFTMTETWVSLYVQEPNKWYYVNMQRETGILTAHANPDLNEWELPTWIVMA